MAVRNYLSACWMSAHLQLNIHLQLSIRMLDVHLQLAIHLQLSIRMLDVHLIEELRSSASRILLPFGGGF